MKSFLLIGLLVALVAPVDTEEVIVWQADRKLTWDDFKGAPHGPEDFVASTNSGVAFSYSYGERNGRARIEYEVTANFYPLRSWYRAEIVDSYILSHEQTHFDITELHARIFRKVLAETDFDLDPQDELADLYEEVEQARRAMQQLYDKETDHSNIRDAEERWVRYVADRLEEYQRWK